jgi:hypothetical protein
MELRASILGFYRARGHKKLYGAGEKEPALFVLALTRTECYQNGTKAKADCQLNKSARKSSKYNMLWGDYEAKEN